MLALCSPRVVAIDKDAGRVEIRIPLNLVTRNSWKTIFFGAIATGADITGGFMAFEAAPAVNVGVLYKDMSIEFLRRVDGNLHMVCKDGKAIQNGIQEASKSGARVNVPVTVEGFVPSHSISDPVVRAKMTLSLKKKLIVQTKEN